MLHQTIKQAKKEIQNPPKCRNSHPTKAPKIGYNAKLENGTNSSVDFMILAVQNDAHQMGAQKGEMIWCVYHPPN